MSTATTEIGTLIFRKATAGGGFRTCVSSGVSVKHIVVRHLAGQTPQQMSDDHELLTLEQIHAALAYYYLNKAEIDEAIADDDRIWEEAQRDPQKINRP